MYAIVVDIERTNVNLLVYRFCPRVTAVHPQIYMTLI